MSLHARFILLPILVAGAALVACGDDDDDGGLRTPTPQTTERTALTESSTPTPAAPSDRSIFELQVGDCFDDAEDPQGEATSVATVPCAQAHDNEVFFEYSMEDGDFPGAETVQEEAFIRCDEEFETFVGLPAEESELQPFPIFPTEESWAEGDRIVYCAIYADDLDKLTGSMEGANR